MQPTRQTLKQDLKQEILAELQHRNQDIYVSDYYQTYAPEDRYRGNMEYRPELHPADIDRIKREVMLELQEEIPVYQHSGPGDHRVYPSSAYAADAYKRTIVDSMKNELLAEMEAERATRTAEMYGYGKLLSDQKLNRMIDQRYRTFDNLKGEIRKELAAIKSTENRRAGTADPYIRDIAQSIAMEAREQGVPLDEVLQRLDRTGSRNMGWLGRMSGMMNVGQRKGVVYGIGAALLVYLLWPSARRNLHSVAVRSMEEGMALAERARSLVNRNKDYDPAGPNPQGEEPGDKNPEIDLLQ